ncbi:hypothetical protein HanXRQr2_Chr13g0592291 [Helianthus annuus]|uniref:Uncharacterized protein n=1 Tax=Helianthus annuus TaxID=4232 RepID=A0A251SWA8_HELAN|nr:hypothetical protein HanXRQr2_Chr13g0592291 [Helianthus annuus]KAJ0477213.1 hypothetical protein HanHA300_Chr13g0485841 [Helianthus annuus]KAJ0481611.1 hypothetical protein HanIR_Chr13g0644491 [Helianthus annuus]KAJ0498047.1 hypothetical protein HanHA89_Chr13g0517981 [Helianthus annuus]KAJ0664046.1 hypothetical protein HanLR1_Chr13g0487811 [Helianthus annuus]
MHNEQYKGSSPHKKTPAVERERQRVHDGGRERESARRRQRGPAVMEEPAMVSGRW